MRKTLLGTYIKIHFPHDKSLKRQWNMQRSMQRASLEAKKQILILCSPWSVTCADYEEKGSFKFFCNKNNSLFKQLFSSKIYICWRRIIIFLPKGLLRPIANNLSFNAVSLLIPCPFLNVVIGGDIFIYKTSWSGIIWISKSIENIWKQ